MIFLPLAGLVNIATTVIIFVNGEGMVLLPTFLFFCFLQYMLCVMAIQLDDEEKKLALYSPLLLLGYKQLCDFIILRSFFDIVFRRKLKWTSAQRVGAQATRKVAS